LNTFSAFELSGGEQGPDLSKVVASFAPALSTTLSGLLMALLNLVMNVFLWLAVPSQQEVDHEA
jgi:hypothetical protein